VIILIIIGFIGVEQYHTDRKILNNLIDTEAKCFKLFVPYFKLGWSFICAIV